MKILSGYYGIKTQEHFYTVCIYTDILNWEPVLVSVEWWI